ncbi:hypothetical protein ACH5RR_026129 [Cinchona calisaya]|uniref:Uncharacterized protein n=1 Tax=Cinchona calisaya TaxID=153742 RepID=A0ABD2Z4V9_9GENT
MTLLQTSCYSVIPPLPPKFIDFSLATIASAKLKRHRRVTSFAAKSGGFSLINSILKKCERCGGQGAIECPGCKGTGKNKKNGNVFERWKCFDCQGFGLKSCPVCGKGGLTPEQRGER